MPKIGDFPSARGLPVLARFEGVKVDQKLKNGDRIQFGDVMLTAHLHPGHTKMLPVSPSMFERAAGFITLASPYGKHQSVDPEGFHAAVVRLELAYRDQLAK